MKWTDGKEKCMRFHNILFESIVFSLCVIISISNAFAGEYYIAGGGGGGGGQNAGNNLPSSGGAAVGNAGAGGNATLTMNMGARGGGGGGAFIGDSGLAGSGGNSTDVITGTGGTGVGLGAGNGESGGGTVGGKGGDGGSAALNENTVTYGSGLSILGGNGGQGQDTNGGMGGAGGNGGDAKLTATTVNVTGTITLLSGKDGDRGLPHVSGTGGAAELIVNGAMTVSGAITATKQDGTLTMNIGILDVGSSTTAGTTLNLNDTVAANVRIANVVLDNGKIFTVNKTGTGAATFTDLNVNGTGILGGDYAPSFATVTLATASNLTSTVNPLAFSTLNVGGQATLDGALSAAGKTLDFTIPNTITAGDTVLTVSGNATLNAGTGYNINYTSGLNAGDTINLISAGSITGTVTDVIVTAGTQKFILNTNGNNLEAQLQALITFLEANNNLFDPLGINSINMRNGAIYLDYLKSVLPAGDPLMAKLEAAFATAQNDAVLGERGAWVATQQFEGAAAAYATTALSVTSGRFRQLWERRNHSFLLDNAVFSSLADAGLASPGALASPVYGARDTVPAGRSRIWASGFGAWAKQDSADNLAGYKYDSRGAALGYEYLFNNCFSLGFAAAYSRGDLKVDDLRYENKPDLLNLALYGVYSHPTGFYAQGGLGYGHAWNDYTIDSIAYAGTQKKGKYGSDDWSANLELGYVAKLPQDFNLIPSVGVEYDYLRNGGWTESVHGNPALPANQFYGDHDNSVAIPLGLRFNKLFKFGCNGGYVIPEVRAAWVYQANKARPFVNAGYAGAPGSGTMYGVEPGSNFWRLGAGVSGRFNERVDFRVDYDFDTRSGFRGHNVLATMGLAF